MLTVPWTTASPQGKMTRDCAILPSWIQSEKRRAMDACNREIRALRIWMAMAATIVLERAFRIDLIGDQRALPT
jgi:hypothetical protein